MISFDNFNKVQPAQPLKPQWNTPGYIYNYLKQQTLKNKENKSPLKINLK